MTDENERETEYFGLPEHDPDTVLMNKLNEMESQENATFRVYRQHSGNNAKMAFCFTVPADQYEWEELLSKIKEEYGAGDYRVHLRGPTQHGKNQLIANTVVSVEAPRQTNPAQPQQQNDLSPIVDKMMERMERMEERLQVQAQQPQLQQKDPMEMMQQMVATMTSMQQMMPQPQQPVSGGKEKSLMEQLKEAREIHEMMGEMGGGDKDGGFGQLMRDGLQPLIQLAQSENEKRKNGQAQPQPKPNPQQRQPQTEPQNGETPAMPPADPQKMAEQIGPLAGHIRMLTAAAQKNTDPEPYAFMVLDFTPDEQYAGLYEFLSTDGCIDAIVKYVPEVEQHRDWFNSLREAVLAELDVDEGEGDTSGHVADESTGPAVGGPADGGSTDDEPSDADGAPAGEGGDAQDASRHVEDGQGGEVEPAHT